ncbi:MAG TPA: ABC transporter substrate-binding protein [Devosia sp.]|jgi:peptide/nickel transport system substrate-binding protein|uniref:ABC transporter substrate-binding protein n=1 Tax=Devosia sp. TaxID=1871048 RepID=UPI002DDD944B|nr:ABC transporter substrate-binding protein [Devosia sp.]HEV2517177.1 ABC transporter substrate-binding protein [Devosia sp.]
MHYAYRPFSKLRFTGTAGAVALCALLAAGAVEAADRANTVIYADAGSVNTLDPIASDYYQTNDLTSRMYSPLVTYDIDLNVVGELASEYAVAPDAQSIAITLRDGAKFHDGKPVTSADVAYTLDRIKRLATGVASYVDVYGSTEITDDTHLTIKLTKPSSLFLTSLSRIYIINSSLAQANAGSDDAQAWLAANDAGSGPYKLISVVGNDITVDWADTYWGEQGARPASFVFRRIDESAPKRDELKVGNIDIGRNIVQRDLDVLANEPGVTVAYGPAPSVNGIYFNTAAGPTADPKVREAIRLVYDYEGGLQGIHRGKGSLPAGPLPGTLACRPDFSVVKRDVERAKALLAEAGQSALTLTLRFQPAFEDQVQEATLLQSNLKDIGVTLNLEPIAFPNYLQLLQDPVTIPQMMLMSENAWFPDPGVFLAKTYISDAGSSNRAGYNNPEIDTLLNKALVSGDANERCEIYKQAQLIIEKDSPFMPLYWGVSYAAYRSDRLADPLAGVVNGHFKPIEVPLLTKG